MVRFSAVFVFGVLGLLGLPREIEAQTAIRIGVVRAFNDTSECKATGAGNRAIIGDPSQAGPNWIPNSQLPECLSSMSVAGNCYLTCTDASILESSKQLAVAAVMDAAEAVKKYVGMQSPRNTVTFGDEKRPCPESFQPFASPNKTLTGVDFGLVVTLRSSNRVAGQEILPYGRTCQVDGNAVPLTGYVNVDPALITGWDATTKERLLVQAVLQALGFNDAHFASRAGFVVKENRPMPTEKAKDKTMEVAYLASPKVLAAVRDHTGCDTLPGAELENGWPVAGQNYLKLYPDGGLYTRLSFFEKRVFGTEAMTRGKREGGEFVVSGLTLAAMEDIGFLRMPGSAEPFTFGAQMGCNFTTESCFKTSCEFLSPINERVPMCAGGEVHALDYFCRATSADPTDSSRNRCSYDLTTKAECPLLPDRAYPQDLGDWAYFTSKPNSGGSEPLADFCPIAQPRNAEGSCRDGFAAVGANSARGEIFGDDSACFMSSARDVGYASNTSAVLEPTCLRYRCTSKTTLQFQMGGTREGYWFDCLTDGIYPSIDGGDLPSIDGKVQCPRAAVLCGDFDPATSPKVPTIDSVVPNSGDVKGGETVTITGADLPVGDDVVVMIAGFEAASCSEKTATQYVCVTAGENQEDPAELGPGFVRIYSKSNPDNGATKKGAYTPKIIDDPSPTPASSEPDKEDSGFFQKKCLSIPCFVLPLIFIGLTIPCCIWKFCCSKKKKDKQGKRKIISDDDDYDGIQL